MYAEGVLSGLFGALLVGADDVEEFVGFDVAVFFVCFAFEGCGFVVAVVVVHPVGE